MALSMSRLDHAATVLEAGRLHYVSGRFFEAHEVWEEGWHLERGPLRRLFQGLIMAAGAYHKLAHGQPAGMGALLERSLERLGTLPDGFGGLALDQFRAGLVRSLAEARAWSAGAPAPSGPAPLGVAVSTAAAAWRDLA